MNGPVVNRRVAEATALRDFFQEQWEYLRQLTSDWQDKRAREQDEAQRISSAVESIVEATDIRIRGVGGYQKRLRSSALNLLDHIKELVAGMPPAISVNQSALVMDPLVNTLFSDRKSLQALFAENPDIQTYFHSKEYADMEDVYALLFLNRLEKNILGVEMKGDILLKEVKQTSVIFYGHQLLGTGPSEKRVRSTMQKILFDSVIMHIKHQIIELRHGQSEKEKRLGALNPKQNINNPAVYIEMLIEQLSLPGKLIKLQDDLMRIDKMGIKLPLDAGASSDVIRLYEVEVSGEKSRIAAIVSYPRSDFFA